MTDVHKGDGAMEQKLETFLALCRTMHYGRAAEQLNLSQPAVSKHIQALESQYGATLFTYSGRRLQKTWQGELLEQYAESLRYNEEELLSRLHEKPRTRLRVGATKSVGKYVLLPQIRRFLAAPENRLEFLVDNTAHLLTLLNRGEMDFVILEGIFDKQHYSWLPFRQEAYIGICPAAHRFAGREVALEELFGERLILREQGSGTRDILERGLVSEGYTLAAFANQVLISSSDIIRTLVREGCGISFLYESVVRGDAELGRFSCPPLTGTHAFNAVFLKNTDAEVTARRFLFGSGRAR